MSFDQNDRRPLFIWSKWTTEINLAMVVGIVIFWIMGHFLVFLLWSRKHAADNPSSAAVSTVEQSAPLVVFRGHTVGGGVVRATPVLARFP